MMIISKHFIITLSCNVFLCFCTIDVAYCNNRAMLHVSLPMLLKPAIPCVSSSNFYVFVLWLRQVRAAANSVVVAMTSRKELRLALTPHKEGLVAIARSGAEDSEPRVAVEGSKAAQNLFWWP